MAPHYFVIYTPPKHHRDYHRAPVVMVTGRSSICASAADALVRLGQTVSDVRLPWTPAEGSDIILDTALHILRSDGWEYIIQPMTSVGAVKFIAAAAAVSDELGASARYLVSRFKELL